MNAPIRDMRGIVEGIRAAAIDREISHATLGELAGVPDGYVGKLFAHKQMKNLGYASTGPLLGAVGKMLLIVDDPEAIARVKDRWVKRKIRGGPAIQMKARASALCAKPEETPVKLEQVPSLAPVAGTVDISEKMRRLRKLVKRESLANSGKRRMKMMKKKARQRMGAHAARKRWSKERERRAKAAR
jgi:hypothetical protein